MSIINMYNPSILQPTINYLNLNKNESLRKQVTEYFCDKIIKWINNDKDFEKHDAEFFESTKGKNYVHQTLRKFIKKSNFKWYELRSNSELVKSFLVKHL